MRKPFFRKLNLEELERLENENRGRLLALLSGEHHKEGRDSQGGHGEEKARAFLTGWPGGRRQLNEQLGERLVQMKTMA